MAAGRALLRIWEGAGSSMDEAAMTEACTRKSLARPLSGKPDIAADMAVGPLLTDDVEKALVIFGDQ